MPDRQLLGYKPYGDNSNVEIFGGVKWDFYRILATDIIVRKVIKRVWKLQEENLWCFHHGCLLISRNLKWKLAKILHYHCKEKKSLYCIKIYSGKFSKISEISLILVSPVTSFILGALTVRHYTSPHLRVYFNISKQYSHIYPSWWFLYMVLSLFAYSQGDLQHLFYREPWF